LQTGLNTGSGTAGNFKVNNAAGNALLTITNAGVATFNGDTTLGNAASDSVLFNGITKLTAIAKTGTTVTITPGSEGGFYYTLGAEASSIALTLATTSAVDGQLVYVYNGDDAATTNIVIPTKSVAMFIFQSSAWRRVEDKQVDGNETSRRRLLSEQTDSSGEAPSQAVMNDQPSFAEVLARLEKKIDSQEARLDKQEQEARLQEARLEARLESQEQEGKRLTRLLFACIILFFCMFLVVIVLGLKLSRKDRVRHEEKPYVVSETLPSIAKTLKNPVRA
jgi:hypothetical protein